MKKQDKMFDSKYSQVMGRVLSHHFGETPIGDCVATEEIAALAEGTLAEEEKERVMAHVSTCDVCYETLMITSEIEEKELEELKKPLFIGFSHPLRLAASIVVITFSLFLFYKFAFVPAAKNELPSNFALTMEAPTAPAERIISHEKKEVLSPKGEGEARTMKTLNDEPVINSGIKEEKSKKKRSKQIVPQKSTPINSPVQESFSLREESDTSENNLAKSRERRSRDKDQQLLQQQQLLTEPAQQQEQEKFQYAHKKDDLPELQQKRGGKGEITSQAKLGAVSPGFRDAPVWEKLGGLKGRYVTRGGYLTSNSAMDLFSSILALCPELKNEIQWMRQQRGGRQTPGPVDDMRRRMQPVVQVVTNGNIYMVFPDVRYMLSRCQPETLEHEFFTLALQGWCEPLGICRGVGGAPSWLVNGEKSKPGRNVQISSELLRKWSALRPRLQGIFQQIAATTIAHLEKFNR